MNYCGQAIIQRQVEKKTDTKTEMKRQAERQTDRQTDRHLRKEWLALEFWLCNALVPRMMGTNTQTLTLTQKCAHKQTHTLLNWGEPLCLIVVFIDLASMHLRYP